MTFSGTPSIDSPLQEKPAEEPPVLVSPPIAPLAVDFWRGRLKGLWIRACQEAVADLRAKRWVRFLVVCWTACLVIGLVMTPLAFASPGYKSPSNYDSMACRPDGSFRPFSFEYDPWGISGFFQITMGYGSLTFTQAKVIDVIWDIGVGRLGQAVLAICTWRAASAYVRCSMETAPVTYDTFWTVFMNDEPSFMGMVRMIRDFSTRRGLRSRLAMTFIILSMVFILAVPTLAGAMTGYSQNNEAFVADLSGNMYSFSQLSPILYTIHDGWRVDFDGDYAVPFSAENVEMYELSFMYQNDLEIIVYLNCDDPDFPQKSTDMCNLQVAISNYTQKYGFFGLDAEGHANDVETMWMGKTLPAPALNISATYLTRYSGVPGWNWTDPRTGLQPFSNPSNLAFKGSSNETFLVDYIIEQGSCQEVGTYKWGFSFLQLYAVLLMLLFWTLGTSAMLLAARSRLASVNIGDVPAKYRAASMLALAMQQEFGTLGKTPDKLTEAQIQHCVNKHLDGGRMRLPTAFSESPSSLPSVVWEWLRRDKWWLIILLQLAILLLAGPFTFVTSDATENLYWAMVGWTASLCFALLVGQTLISRLFFVCLGVLLSTAGLLIYIIYSMY